MICMNTSSCARNSGDCRRIETNRREFDPDTDTEQTCVTDTDQLQVFAAQTPLSWCHRIVTLKMKNLRVS